MNKDIINYIKTLSENKITQELLIKVIGKILLKQNNIEFFIKENQNKIIHIRDWIASIIENEEQFKIPRVFTIDALNNNADKYFEKKRNKLIAIELNETHEKLIADLGEYYIVQMLTPEALDNESKQMQNCIGHGGYDHKLQKSEFKYLSLRDKFNKSHVTIEIKNNSIEQLQGKQNKLPEKKYLEKLIPWFDKNSYEINHYDSQYYFDRKIMKYLSYDKVNLEYNIDYSQMIDIINRVKVIIGNDKFFYKKRYNLKINNAEFCVDKQKKITYFRTESLKKSFFIKSILRYLEKNNYSDIPYEEIGYILNKINNKIYSLKKLPNNVEINGNLDLYDYNLNSETKFKAPKVMKINGNLTINDIQIHTGIEKLEVNGNVVFCFCDFRDFDFNKLKMNKNITFSYCKIKKLPDNFVVNGSLDIQTSLEKLPKGLEVKGNFHTFGLETLPSDINVWGNLNLSYSSMKELPDNFTANKDLNLFSCQNFKKLPKNLIVKGNLILSLTSIKEIPDDIIIGKNLDIRSSYIKKLPDNLKCENLYIDKNCISLIKETMDFEKIYITKNNNNNICYSKKEFFETDLNSICNSKLYRFYI